MVRITVLVIALVTSAASPLFADDRDATVASPFGRGRWTTHLVGDAYREAWDYNLSDEDLFGATLGVMRRTTRNWSFGAEALLLGVHQETVRSTTLSGFALLARWEPPRTGLTPYIEGGAGLSYSASVVPARGTRFNYVAQIGGGITVPLQTGRSLQLGLQWLHLSNNSLAGRGRNPDIQAVGIRCGVIVPL